MMLLTASETAGPAASKCVLLVEDNTDDALTACRELKKLNLCNPVCQVETFGELVAYLNGGGEYSDRRQNPCPGLIVVDMHLPDADGLQVQAWLRSTPDYKNIPLIAISSVDRLTALKTAVTLGANGWMTKPFKKDDFFILSQTLKLPITFENPLHPPQLPTFINPKTGSEGVTYSSA